MGKFSGPLTVTKIGERLWRVEAAFTFSPTNPNFDIVAILQGFVTDFASVPQPFWNLFPPDGEYTQAAVMHDYLYGLSSDSAPGGRRKRSECDSLFLDAMKTLGVPFYQRWPMYLAVRSFGWLPFKKN